MALTGISARQIRTAAPVVVSGDTTVPSEGTSSALARSDHHHTIDLDAPNMAVVAAGSLTARTLPVRFARVRDVKDFGAIGDGSSHPLSGFYGTLGAAQAVYPHAVALTDEIDWAATQAAINAAQRDVAIPRGKYRWNRQISCPDAISLFGEGQGSSSLAWSGGVGTVIDATGITSGYVVDNTVAGGSGRGSVFEDFYIEAATGANVIIWRLGGEATMRRVRSERGRIGVVLIALNCMLEACTWNLQTYHGVEVYQLGGHRFRACTFANATLAGSANVYLYGAPYDVKFDDCFSDECFGAGSISIVFASGTNLSWRGGRILNGPGGGLKLGDGGIYPARVTIEDVRIEPFSSSPQYQIIVDTATTGVRLINVSTTGQTVADINDLAADTVWYNLNGKFKMPSLPSANPGGGSKQLWYDAADSNRVKFAP